MTTNTMFGMLIWAIRAAHGAGIWSTPVPLYTDVRYAGTPCTVSKALSGRGAAGVLVKLVWPSCDVMAIAALNDRAGDLDWTRYARLQKLLSSAKV